MLLMPQHSKWQQREIYKERERETGHVKAQVHTFPEEDEMDKVGHVVTINGRHGRHGQPTTSRGDCSSTLSFSIAHAQASNCMDGMDGVGEETAATPYVVSKCSGCISTCVLAVCLIR